MDVSTRVIAGRKEERKSQTNKSDSDINLIPHEDLCTRALRLETGPRSKGEHTFGDRVETEMGGAEIGRISAGGSESEEDLPRGRLATRRGRACPPRSAGSHAIPRRLSSHAREPRETIVRLSNGGLVRPHEIPHRPYEECGRSHEKPFYTLNISVFEESMKRKNVNFAKSQHLPRIRKLPRSSKIAKYAFPAYMLLLNMARRNEAF